MILDHLDRAERYHGLHPRFAAAFAWVRGPGQALLPRGRIAIAGETLFALVDEGTLTPAADKRFESHRRYIDIQVNLAGGEGMACTPSSSLQVLQDFEAGGDNRFYAEPAASSSLVVPPQWFAIFYPEDAHKACCQLGAHATAYRKVVLKVQIATG